MCQISQCYSAAFCRKTPLSSNSNTLDFIKQDLGETFDWYKYIQHAFWKLELVRTLLTEIDHRSSKCQFNLQNLLLVLTANQYI